jgi:hypothetical protein
MFVIHIDQKNEGHTDDDSGKGTFPDTKARSLKIK